jgi:hypothetical protein
MNLWIHKRLEISSPVESLWASQAGLSAMKSVSLLTYILGLKLSQYNIAATFTAEFL